MKLKDRKWRAQPPTDRNSLIEHSILINKVRVSAGLLPKPEGNDTLGRRITKHLTSAKLTPEAHEGLLELASLLGYVWNSDGNVTQLLEALGQGLFELSISPFLFEGVPEGEQEDPGTSEDPL